MNGTLNGLNCPPKPTKVRRKRQTPHSKLITGTMVTGICPFCFEKIQADQPGGRNPRHLDDTPYGFCFKGI
jgi:hypothetical protein